MGLMCCSTQAHVFLRQELADLLRPLFLFFLPGRASESERPAGGGEQRVAAGMLQSRGHGDAAPLHVA